MDGSKRFEFEVRVKGLRGVVWMIGQSRHAPSAAARQNNSEVRPPQKCPSGQNGWTNQ